MSGKENTGDKDKKDDTPIVPLDEADITILKTYVRCAGRVDVLVARVRLRLVVWWVVWSC
jgi:hypothetical protein